MDRMDATGHQDADRAKNTILTHFDRNTHEHERKQRPSNSKFQCQGMDKKNGRRDKFKWET